MSALTPLWWYLDRRDRVKRLQAALRDVHTLAVGRKVDGSFIGSRLDIAERVEATGAVRRYSKDAT